MCKCFRDGFDVLPTILILLWLCVVYVVAIESPERNGWIEAFKRERGVTLSSSFIRSVVFYTSTGRLTGSQQQTGSLLCGNHKAGLNRREQSRVWSIEQCHFYDLEWPLKQFSRVCHYSTSSISEIIRDRQYWYYILINVKKTSVEV